VPASPTASAAAARLRCLAPRTEAHFELWRHERDFTAWKYRMHEKGLKLPTQTKNDLARCFCGVEITNRSLDAHIRAFHRGIGA